jgi:hypothetical protein
LQLSLDAITAHGRSPGNSGIFFSFSENFVRTIRSTSFHCQLEGVMKLIRAILAFAVVGLLQVTLAHADIPPTPRDLPPGKSMERLQVKIDASKDISTLRIPRSALNDAGLDIREKKNAKPSDWSPTKMRSVVAALAMSLGIGGVFLVRKKKGAAIASALVAATIVGTLGVQAWANVPAPLNPPPAPIPAPEVAGVINGNFSGNVVIEIIEDEGDVQLTIGTKPLPKQQRVLPPRSTNAPPDAR